MGKLISPNIVLFILINRIRVTMKQYYKSGQNIINNCCHDFIFWLFLLHTIFGAINILW